MRLLCCTIFTHALARRYAVLNPATPPPITHTSHRTSRVKEGNFCKTQNIRQLLVMSNRNVLSAFRVAFRLKYFWLHRNN